MITIIEAGALTGYSQTDHLIDETEVKKIVGKQFPTVKKALAAADSKCFMETAKGYKKHPYTWIKVKMADGSIKEFKSV